MLTNLTKSNIILGVIGVEGGYVNDPNDRGGETNFGITKAVALQVKADLIQKFKWDQTMKHLTKDMAVYIYGLNYWDPLKLDMVFNLSPAIADKLFDQAVNCGVAQAATWLQTLLNVLNQDQKLYPDMVVDGHLGLKTIDALSRFIKARGTQGQWAILKGLICLQGSHYISISESRTKNETFTFGWLNRLDHNLDLYYKAFH